MRRMEGRSARGPWLNPLTIACLYAAAGFLWILFSDRIVHALVPSPDWRDLVQTLKGWSYVAVTAVLLFVLIRRYSQQLLRSEQQQRAIVASLADGVVVGDREEHVISVNDTARTMLGLDGLQLPVTLRELLRGHLPRSEEDGAQWMAQSPLVRALRGELVSGVPITWRRGDGTEVLLEGSAAPVRHPQTGEVLLAVSLLRDVTEVRRLEKLRDRFLSDAAHELKTPVATLKTYVQLLRRWAPHGHEPREGVAFEVLERQSDRIARLVEQLLQVALLQQGAGVRDHAERFELGALVGEVQARFVPLEGHRLRMESDPALPVNADREGLRMVLESLLDNAVKFSPPGSTIHLRAGREGDEARLTVRDEGVGIPAAAQPHVGERFFKAHVGEAADAGGLGVGLFLSRAIVARAGGRLWFDSREGGGTAFHVALPLDQPPPAAPPRAPEPAGEELGGPP